MVLERNSSSLKKNQKMSVCKILAVSGGYLARLTWACTTLYHSSTLLLPCWKLVRRSNLVCTSFDCGLQKSSNFPHIISRVNWLVGKPQETYWSMQNPQTKLLPFCIAAFLVMLQAHIQECSHIWDTTSGIYGIDHHSLSSPSWDLLYMA